MIARHAWLATALVVACERPGDGRAAVAAPDAPGDSIVARGPRGLADSLFPRPSRPVSSIVSPRWTNEDARDDAGEAARVLDAAGVGAGTTVADVGAGDGYYTVRAAARVGAAGRVYAEDIEPRYLELLRARLRAKPLPNVVLALGEPHDPRLPPDAIDVVLMIHMYHEITQPFGLLTNLRPALRAGARVAIVDQDAPTSAHGTPPTLLRCEVESIGYRFVRSQSIGGGAYLAIFSPPATREALTPATGIAASLRARGCPADTVPA